MLVSASAGKIQVGISGNPVRRLAQHNGRVPDGAKATRAGRPWTIGAIFGPYAQRVEQRVKRLRGRARLEYAGD